MKIPPMTKVDIVMTIVSGTVEALLIRRYVVKRNWFCSKEIRRAT